MAAHSSPHLKSEFNLFLFYQFLNEHSLGTKTSYCQTLLFWHHIYIPQNCILRYDPSTDLWRRMKSMNRSRMEFPLVACSGSLFAIGGNTNDYTNRAQVRWIVNHLMTMLNYHLLYRRTNPHVSNQSQNQATVQWIALYNQILTRQWRLMTIM